MSWLEESDASNRHVSPETVPVARIGGVLRKGLGWSATAFPVSLNGRTILLTPQHVLDGAGSSSILAIANGNVMDEREHTIDLDAWVVSSVLDLAAVEVSTKLTKDWAQSLWGALAHSADLDQIGPGDDLDVHLCAMPRPLPGAVTEKHPIMSGVNLDIRKLATPDEFVLPCVAYKGTSGSPVFLSDGSQFGFAGIVTSAAVDQQTGKVLGSVALGASGINDFLRTNFA